MDHVWNSLKEWESIWNEELEEEKNMEYHNHKMQNIKLLEGQLDSIRKAMREIEKWV